VRPALRAVARSHVARAPRVWVIANFKETQLRKYAAGTTCTVSIDAYQELKLTRTCRQHQAGSGAASLCAAGKRDGQLCEVVQRVPVRSYSMITRTCTCAGRAFGGSNRLPVGGEVGCCGKVAIGAIILAAGVILGAVLWIGRVRRGQA